MIERSQILQRIKGIAKANGGTPPGVAAFENETGIGQHKWRGVHWARWTDALAEAGFSPNSWQGRFESGAVLNKVVELTRELQALPTNDEMKLKRRQDPSFPNPKTITAHFGSRADLVHAIRTYCSTHAEGRDLLPLLPDTPAASVPVPATKKSIDGWVYLIKMGDFFKIGRSDELERRVKEIRLALPETANLIHAISTDDPAGIEAYWHRRFAANRANGEWFKLGVSDVTSFKRRKFQ